MVLQLIALLCTGIFAGAAIYISAVEHPARSSAESRSRWLSSAELPASRRDAGHACSHRMPERRLGLGSGRGALVLLAGILLGAVIPSRWW